MLIIVFICKYISAYCSDPPPNLNGGTCGSPNTTTVHCRCSSGYQSTGVAQPYLTCTYFNSSHGFWNLTYSCFALYALSITRVVTKIALFNSPLSLYEYEYIYSKLYSYQSGRYIVTCNRHIVNVLYPYIQSTC